MRRRTCSFIVAALMALVVAAPAAAAPRHQVTIDSACIDASNQLLVQVSWTNQPGGYIEMVVWGRIGGLGFERIGPSVPIVSSPNDSVQVIGSFVADWNAVTVLYAQPDKTAPFAWIDFSKNTKRPRTGWRLC